MDYIYNFGINVVLAVQETFIESEKFFELVNDLTTPNNIINYVFPLVSIFDSVFAADLLLTASLTKWFSAMLKWILNEDRPYWWIRETKYFKNSGTVTPKLFTNYQTCETSPGNPSGHVLELTVLLCLCVAWIIEIRGRDFCLETEHTKIFAINTTMFILITVTSISRMYVSAHFPHQCILAMVLGKFIVDKMANSTTQFLQLDEEYKEKPQTVYNRSLRHKILIHICMALVLIVVAITFYWIMKYFSSDPVYSIKLAFKWCPSAMYLHHSTTPFYVFVMATGSMLGWSLCVTPAIKSYRYNTKGRSYLIAVAIAFMIHQIFHQWQDSISKTDASYFYIVNFAAFILRPLFFIRIIPTLAMCRNKWQAFKAKEEPKLKDKKKI